MKFSVSFYYSYCYCCWTLISDNGKMITKYGTKSSFNECWMKLLLEVDSVSYWWTQSLEHNVGTIQMVPFCHYFYPDRMSYCVCVSISIRVINLNLKINVFLVCIYSRCQHSISTDSNGPFWLVSVCVCVCVDWFVRLCWNGI